MGKNNETIYSKKIAINKCVYYVHPIVHIHVNNDKQDTRLCNLQVVTQEQNCKKPAKDRYIGS